MPIPVSNKTKFWVVCCEETEATQQISQAVAQWQLPGVRSLLCNHLPLSEADAIAQSDYAIFITRYPQPCAQIKVSPLSVSSRHSPKPHLISQGPVALLSAVHNRHGQSPQAWWFQLPMTEIRAQRVQPVSTEKTVAQALNQIEIFVRNYRLAVAPRTSGTHEIAETKQLATAQV
ncbi:MAG: hypothetical protein WBB01_16070 [Phormidesmis sp.]